MNNDPHQEILDSLTDYFDQNYDGTEMPLWVEALARAYAEVCDGPKMGPDFWPWVEKKISENLKARKGAS